MIGMVLVPIRRARLTLRRGLADGAARLCEVGLRDVRHRLTERVGRFGVPSVALVVVVAKAVVGAEFFGVAVASAARTVGGHRLRSSLTRLAMPGMTPAPLAVLAQRDAIRVIALGLLGLVVPALAVLACEGHSDPDVSAGHGRRAPRVVGSWVRAGQRKTPPRREVG